MGGIHIGTQRDKRVGPAFTLQTTEAEAGQMHVPVQLVRSAVCALGGTPCEAALAAYWRLYPTGTVAVRFWERHDTDDAVEFTLWCSLACKNV